jgi:hypothetical protein
MVASDLIADGLQFDPNPLARTKKPSRAASRRILVHPVATRYKVRVFCFCCEAVHAHFREQSISCEEQTEAFLCEGCSGRRANHLILGAN